MNFDPENPVVKLCAQGMQAEAVGDTAAAHELFEQAWNIAANDFERFTAAHYFARHQPTAQLNLHWNVEALRFAQQIPGDEGKGHFPSLYLNVGKSYEDLGQKENAIEYYRLAHEYTQYLTQDGYGNMIRRGIHEALKRMDATPPSPKE